MTFLKREQENNYDDTNISKSKNTWCYQNGFYLLIIFLLIIAIIVPVIVNTTKKSHSTPKWITPQQSPRQPLSQPSSQSSKLVSFPDSNLTRTCKAHHIIKKTIYYTRHCQSMQNAAMNGNAPAKWGTTEKDAPVSYQGFEQLPLLARNIEDETNTKWDHLRKQLESAISNDNYTVGFLSSNLRRAVITEWTILNALKSNIVKIAGITSGTSRSQYPFMDKMLMSPYLREMNNERFVPSQSVLLSNQDVIPRLNESLTITYSHVATNGGNSALKQNVQDVAQTIVTSFSQFDVLSHQNDTINERLKNFVQYIQTLPYDTLVIGGHSGWIVQFFRERVKHATCSFNLNHPEDIKNTQVIRFDVLINTNDISKKVNITNCSRIYL